MIDKTLVRTLGVAWLAVAGVAGMVRPASALVGGKGDEGRLVTLGRAARPYRPIAWQRDDAMDVIGLRGWTAMVDADTDVPVRAWGPGQLASGTMSSAATAEAWARRFLAEHLSVLAPGAAASDFVVVSNELNPSGDVRSVGFAQYAGGVEVRGGAISFAFKNDRMIMVGSTALPNVPVGKLALRSTPRLSAARASTAAVTWLASAGRQVVARSGVGRAQVILPIIHPRGAGGVDISYTLAEQIEVETTDGAPGRWNVFVDAATGAAVAREPTLSFATGKVVFNVAVRAPTADAGRTTLPTAGAVHKVNGVDTTAAADGTVTWTGNADAAITIGLTGAQVAITTKAGALVNDALTLSPGGTVQSTHATEEQKDAQLAAFIYASQAKKFVKDNINPGLTYLDRQLSVTVNETGGQCNAYSTGDDIHFFPRTALTCENTGRMADVVYHEFGHSMHRQSVIPAVGVFNPSMSEGVADTLAVAITGDSGMGRGFFLANFAGRKPNDPLRELNPAIKKVWPKDATGEVHDEGEIYGEAMWDLRKKLETTMGQAAGFAHFLKVYYGTVQRAVDIPSSFAEALVADDDDGNLANGTPHECEIISAFAAHGLYDPTRTGDLAPPVRQGAVVTVSPTTGLGAACAAPTVTSGTLSYRSRGGSSTSIAMASSGGKLSATIPTLPAGIVEYTVTLKLADGSTRVFPDNVAEPYYQFSVGETTQLWCTDFEAGAADWIHNAIPATADHWAVGTPTGKGGGPTQAFQGTRVLGTALNSTGQYDAMSTKLNLLSPMIDLQGHRNVHLQYWRWLGVEDGFFDNATITANNVIVWRNAASKTNPGTKALNHIDREWMFHDVPLSSATASGASSLQLNFFLSSDDEFQAAGWNLDQVCLVALPAACGNQIVDPDETCDDGNAADGDGCSAACKLEDAGGGCCGVGTHPAGPLGLSALVLGLALRRRRAKRAA